VMAFKLDIVAMLFYNIRIFTGVMSSQGVNLFLEVSDAGITYMDEVNHDTIAHCNMFFSKVSSAWGAHQCIEAPSIY
jgi:hypothetical protein